MRQVGLHLRFIDNLLPLLHKAIMLKLPLFQCFLTVQRTGALMAPTDAEVEQFVGLRRQYGGDLYLHISYHANACEPYGLHRIQKELMLARRLEFTHAVLHPGSGKWCGDKERGIRVLVKTLNVLTQTDDTPLLLLENSAHGSLSVGGDMADFAAIAQGLKRPERVKFCVDTAHAFSYGYNLADDQEQDRFIALLEDCLGIEHIALIHLNDTMQQCGSLIDQHHIIGQGRIGSRALKRFCLHPKLCRIPLLLELPLVPEEQEREIYNQVCSWHES